MTVKNDATQDTGVPESAETNETTTEERELSPREMAMEAISVHRESEEVGSTDSQLAAQVAEPKQEPKEDKVLEAEALDKMRVKIKIDGVESEVTVAEMQRQFQKNGAAERRLEEATRLLNEARNQKPPVGLEQQKQAEDTAINPKANTSGESEEEDKEFLAALFEGDETKALDLLRKIRTGRPQEPTLDTSQLAAQLTPAIKQQLVFDSALEKFRTDYADIVADPYLANLADIHLDEEVKAGKPFTEALEEAGKKTRDWLVSKGVKPPQPTPTIDRNTKLERKAGIDKIPALNSKATVAEETEQSATDVIAEMRKARGLAF
jgi:hypothetical protein